VPRAFVPTLCAFALAGASLVLSAAEGSRVADAAMQSDRAAVRALLSAGDDVNAAQGDGMTALHWAARHGDVELIRMLLSAGGGGGRPTPPRRASQTTRRC
jgi:hypothetical protein